MAEIEKTIGGWKTPARTGLESERFFRSLLDRTFYGMTKKTLLFLSVGTLTMFGVIGDSYAYLDPGTGSIILQGLIAGIAGAATVASLYWHKIKAFFSSSSRDNQKTEEDPHNDQS